MSAIAFFANEFFSFVDNLSKWRKRYSYFKNQKNSFNQSKAIVRKAKEMGFTADEYIIYDLANNDYREYLSEYERMRFREKARPYKIIMDNKILFNILISKYGRTNKLLAYKLQGLYVAYEKGFEFEHIIDRLREYKKIVFKLESGPGGGAGFRLLEFSNNLYYVNKSVSTEQDIYDILGNNDDYLLEEYCQQNVFESTIFPSSVNTMRLITVRQTTGKYELIAALHRFGSVKDACVDNASAGGLFSQIDIETGTLSSATSYKDLQSIRILHKQHPITGTQIEGVRIPGWNTIVKDICNLHHCISFTGVPFVAWDVALTDKGIVVIEGNTSCGFKFLQRWHGERNGRVGVWMKENGFIY